MRPTGRDIVEPAGPAGAAALSLRTAPHERSRPAAGRVALVAGEPHAQAVEARPPSGIAARNRPSRGPHRARASARWTRRARSRQAVDDDERPCFGPQRPA